jgi:hypothetical protein
MEDVMAVRTAEAEWLGNLGQGAGHMRFGSNVFDGFYDFRSRMGDGKGTNPEELLGAAHVFDGTGASADAGRFYCGTHPYDSESPFRPA